MLKFDLPEERWLSLSEQPALLAASTGAGWQGFEFQEIQVPHEGEFDNSSINLRLVWISGLQGGLHWPPCAFAYPACCPAASRINRAISWGWVISERWLAFTWMVLAPIRFAMKRSRSGLMVRSSVETA